MISQRDIVLLPFPFSDLISAKVRPVIVVSNDEYNRKSKDMIVVPMTTNLEIKEYAFLITNNDLESGKLLKDSKVKIDRIFSVSRKIVRMKIGKVKDGVLKRVKEEIYKLF